MNTLLSKVDFGCEKIHISSMWTPLERTALMGNMLLKQVEFSDLEEKLLSKVPIDPAGLRSVVLKRGNLENLLYVLANLEISKDLLESNRHNFKDFIIP